MVHVWGYHPDRGKKSPVSSKDAFLSYSVFSRFQPSWLVMEDTSV